MMIKSKGVANKLVGATPVKNKREKFLKTELPVQGAIRQKKLSYFRDNSTIEVKEPTSNTLIVTSMLTRLNFPRCRSQKELDLFNLQKDT